MRNHQLQLSGRRSFAMLMTVLLMVATSSIALAIIHQDRIVSRSADARTGAEAARTEATKLMAALESDLAGRPNLFLSEVLQGESPRLCLYGTNAGTSYPAGVEWPPSCGTRWMYEAEPVGQAGTSAQIISPSTDDDLLRIAVKSRTAAGFSYALTSTFSAKGTDRVAVAVVSPDTSVSAVDMSDVTAPSSSVELLGALYATAISNSETIDSNLAGPEVIAAESLTEGVSGATPLYGDVAAMQFGAANVRSVIPTSITPSSITSAAANVKSIACARSHTNVSDDRSERLCISPGGAVTLTSGEIVDIPDNALAVGIVPTVVGMKLFYRTSETDVTASSPLHFTDGIAASAAAVPDHPRTLANWTLLGEVNQPWSGAVHSTVELTVGMCGSAPGSSPCANQEGQIEGVLFRHATSISAPRIIIGTNIHADAPVALTSEFDVVIPYWARPGDLLIQADVSGAGTGSESGVRAFPSALSWSGAGDPDYSGRLTFDGTVTSVGFGTAGVSCGGSLTPSHPTLGLCGFDEVVFTGGDGRGSLWSAPQGQGWERVSTSRGLLTAESFTWDALASAVQVFDASYTGGRGDSSVADLAGGASLSGADLDAGGWYGFSSGGATATAPRSPSAQTSVAGVFTAESCAQTSGPMFGVVGGLSIGCDSSGYVSAFNGSTLVATSTAPAEHASVVAVDDGSNISLYVAGVDHVSVPGASSSGASVFVGTPVSGEVNEFAVVGRALVPGEIETVVTYLTRKWSADPGAIPFSPAQLDLMLWVDSTRPMTLTEVDGAVVEISPAGETSVGSLTAFEGRGASYTGSINGNAALRFSGTYVDGDAYVSANITNTYRTTLAFVVQSSSVDGYIRQVFSGAGTSPQAAQRSLTWQSYAGTLLNSGSTVDTSPVVVVAVFDNLESHLWVDGVLTASGPTGTRSWSNEPIIIGAGCSSCTGAPTNTYWQGDLGELVLAEGSDVDPVALSEYLGAKWGVAVGPF